MKSHIRIHIKTEPRIRIRSDLDLFAGSAEVQHFCNFFHWYGKFFSTFPGTYKINMQNKLKKSEWNCKFLQIYFLGRIRFFNSKLLKPQPPAWGWGGKVPTRTLTVRKGRYRYLSGWYFWRKGSMVSLSLSTALMLCMHRHGRNRFPYSIHLEQIPVLNIFLVGCHFVRPKTK